LVQTKTVKAARGTFTVLKDGSKKLDFLAAHGWCRRVTLRKFLDTACGIDELLFAREERVAGRADADPEITPCGASGVGCPAGAGDVGLVVAGMNVSFHGVEKEPRTILVSSGSARGKRRMGQFLSKSPVLLAPRTWQLAARQFALNCLR